MSSKASPQSGSLIKVDLRQMLWHSPIIPVNQKAETGGMQTGGQSGQLRETPTQKLIKRAVDVAQ